LQSWPNHTLQTNVFASKHWKVSAFISYAATIDLILMVTKLRKLTDPWQCFCSFGKQVVLLWK